MQEFLSLSGIESWFKGLQDHICSELEKMDGGAKFNEDIWEHKGGGGGRTRTITNGNVLEKGGVAYSSVSGDVNDKILKVLGIASNTNEKYFATGVSLVMHPKSPMVPIIHMNVRYFELSNGLWWFGGGIDLTPHYIVKEDARWFHQILKNVCDKAHETYYSRFKTWADEYFYLPHRQETRGVGGVFFDRLNEEKEPLSKAELWDFVKNIGMAFASTYTQICEKNKNLPYTEKEQIWQKLRRGRYVEFNLVLDRGTKFGLETDGRTESILLSMPPLAAWEYNYQVPSNSTEATTLALLKKDIDWLNIQ